MRALFTLIHRWIGLAIASFIIVSGLTGAVISWDHELDDLINPHLMFSSTQGERLPPLEIMRRAQKAEPRVFITYMALNPEDGKNYELVVEPKTDPNTSKLYDLDFNRLYYDPVTGTEVGRRNWGAAWPVTRETVISFLYKLHYMYHIPAMWGTDRWGYWLLGIVALVWTIDCFIGFYLTLPLRQAKRKHRALNAERQSGKSYWERWKPAWKIKTSGSAYRINFDIHRAFGLWFWLVLFIVAFTGFSLNLYREVFYPVMSMVSKVTPDIFATRPPTPFDEPVIPQLTFSDILKKGEIEAKQMGIQEPPGALFYAPRWGVYGVSLFERGDSHGTGGVGPEFLTFDQGDGRFLGRRTPWKGTAADIFVQAQFPLHSGRILGIPGRILISLVGLVCAALAITGVVIWYRKRRARIRVRVSELNRAEPLLQHAASVRAER
ncbi:MULTISPECIES: PepSY-associated TM helix domain-containing protein [unclassified Beijerinckia]|uniref:PepSY-associated TM helix domain-containing protein n=1 Tax=unclassified Beijerinckia TaxID=2638183 RepID=UPI000899D6ED|nr:MULTISPECIES: PepSY-associated TM helix domain-containing protein [unclassified Beijerinckia]MDH7797107.1 putative iron-regulated membrane protein [Beijerinckia sp. GAS462]SEC72497.1 Uncharacterized iron-regulated membrane protein [Beijerinckia sp. 28-YEA-48]